MLEIVGLESNPLSHFVEPVQHFSRKIRERLRFSHHSRDKTGPSSYSVGECEQRKHGSTHSRECPLIRCTFQHIQYPLEVESVPFTQSLKDQEVAAAAVNDGREQVFRWIFKPAANPVAEALEHLAYKLGGQMMSSTGFGNCNVD